MIRDRPKYGRNPGQIFMKNHDFCENTTKSKYGRKSTVIASFGIAISAINSWRYELLNRENAASNEVLKVILWTLFDFIFAEIRQVSAEIRP